MRLLSLLPVALLTFAAATACTRAPTGDANAPDVAARVDDSDGTGAGADAAAQTDAAQTDAAQPDAGQPDAGQPDAAQPDAATQADGHPGRAAFVPKASHERAIGGGWLAAGQPSQARVVEVVALGATVLTLRHKSEEPFDEAKLVADQGGTFVRYAVSTPQYSDAAFRAKLWDLYDSLQAKGGLVYLHCASSNRVGASWALYQWERKGLSKTDALALGKQAGMGSASATVKQVMGL